MTGPGPDLGPGPGPSLLQELVLLPAWHTLPRHHHRSLFFLELKADIKEPVTNLLLKITFFRLKYLQCPRSPGVAAISLPLTPSSHLMPPPLQLPGGKTK